ncbi:DUF892 family protein [Kaistella yonginensis]|uniref:DUF892 family protein n=1 Tax=Kaistella yonginensis TaxID=658267 RepID=UPI0025B30721|nr:DUF892 family protein [Kaistella yonginensis]MDN3607182.1 DUF892 family protein [Kaistella yonginensis]
MKNIEKTLIGIQSTEILQSKSLLNSFFIQSLQEMFYAENVLAQEFAGLKNQIISSDLENTIGIHFAIHLKHKERLEKIFQLINVSNSSTICSSFNALLSEGKNQLSVFSDDHSNWEIALILVSQKLTHYKIASYGGLAHLAIKLNHYKAATLLAFSVQEEEDYISNNLNGVIDRFMASRFLSSNN